MINDQEIHKTSKNKRFSKLASLGQVLFHSGDLANIWGIKSESTLRQTLSRYVAQGLLTRIHKGFYSLKDPAGIDSRLLGVKSMHAYSYVSCETVLSSHGAINQSPSETTMVGGVSKRFEIAGRRFRARKLADAFLYNDAGIEMIDSVPTATLARAVADMLYFNPQSYLDARDSSVVDWSKVREIAEAVGYNIQIP